MYAGEGEDGTEAMHEDDSLLSSTVPECIATMQHQRGAIEALGCMMWYVSLSTYSLPMAIELPPRYLRQLNIDKDILGMKNFNIYDPMKRGQGLTLDGQSLAHLEVRTHIYLSHRCANLNFLRFSSIMRGLKRALFSACSRVARRPQVSADFTPSAAADRCSSGKRLFRLWLCMPLRDVADINARSVIFCCPALSTI